jgi:predicted lipoprotein with Yx(FWY)xxD motif
MQMNFMNRKAMPLALGLCAMVALAACGSSGKTATVTPGAQPAAATTVAPTSSTPPVVMTASISLGTILVDAKGMTLYTLTSGGKPVACTGQCATFWPPLMLASGMMTAMGAPGVTGLGTATAGAGLQVTANGDPLYRFSKDVAPGDTNGDGISSFGGTWHVVKADAAAATAPTPVVTSPPATTTPTTSLYGY